MSRATEILSRMPEARQRKTEDEWRVHLDNGYGWDEVSSHPSFQKARQTAREYRANPASSGTVNRVKVTGPHRVPRSQ